MGNTVQALGKGLFTLCAYDINQKGAVFEFNKVFFFSVSAINTALEYENLSGRLSQVSEMRN